MIKQTLTQVNDAVVFQDDALDQQLAIQLTGGTVAFECSVDEATWSACPVVPLAGGASVTTAAAAGIFFAAPATGLSLKGVAFRVRLTSGGPVDVFLQPVRV